MENLFDLSGKVAVVTGSTKGIGRAIAEQMAFNGADVVISSRKEDACHSVADAINALTTSKVSAGDIIVIFGIDLKTHTSSIEQ